MCKTYQVLLQDVDNEFKFTTYNIDADEYHKVQQVVENLDKDFTSDSKTMRKDSNPIEAQR